MEVLINDSSKKVICVILLVLCFLFGFLLSKFLFCREDLSDNGISASNVGKQLKDIGEEQRGISIGISESKNIAESIGSISETNLESIECSKISVDKAGKFIKESGVAIKDCQRILSEVRKSGEVKAE